MEDPVAGPLVLGTIRLFVQALMCTGRLDGHAVMNAGTRKGHRHGHRRADDEKHQEQPQELVHAYADTTGCNLAIQI